jgi:hypothetical protein
MAEVMGVKYESLKRCIERFEGQRPVRNRQPGRPPAVAAEVRLKIRNCFYVGSYCQALFLFFSLLRFHSL